MTVTRASSCEEAIVYVSEYLHRIGSITLLVQLAPGYEAVSVRFPAKVSQSLELVYRHNEDSRRMLTRKVKLPVDFGSQFTGTERSFDNKDCQVIQLSIRATAVAIKDEPDQFSFLNDTQLTIPLSSKYLSSFASSESEFSCLNCQGDLLSCRDISYWKALPSETWAEMMDFWHCHKPSVSDEKPSSFNPSYAISSFHAYPSTALVGLSYILFHPSHCKSSQVFIIKENVPGAKHPLVCCAKCLCWMGFKESSDTLKIHKWSIQLQSSLQQPLNYPEYFYISSTIEELISSHGIYTFSLTPEDYSNEKQEVEVMDKEKALIWIFNPDFRFCTSSTRGDVDRGLKVFYSADLKAIPNLKKTRGDVEQMFFPQRIIDNLLQHLDQNSKLYPEDSQSVGKDWKVSILKRL